MENKQRERITGVSGEEDEILLPEDRWEEDDIFSDREEHAKEAQAQSHGAVRLGTRDFQNEVKALMERYPEVRELFRKGGKLPGEVIAACTQEDIPLRVAYAEYEAKQARAETEQIRRENEILKQNAAAAAKAPVKGTASGGSTDTKGMDPFLKGFHSDD